MRPILETIGLSLVMFGIFLGLFVVINTANSKEPTDLDDAINRPIVIVRIVDKMTGTVCFFNKRFPQYMSCARHPSYFFKGIESGEIVIDSEEK